MNELRLAVFDCDGTLVDSQHAIYHSMSSAFASRGLALPNREDVRRVVGLPLANAILQLTPNADPELVEALCLGYSDEWKKMRSTQMLEEPLFPGTLEVIETLANTGWLLGVATGKSYRGLVATLEHYEILDRFVTLQTSDKVVHGKPHPDMMLAALKEAGVTEKNAVMIGDTTFDMDMSRNAGVRAIGVNWGYHDENELLACGAECVIQSFGELPAILNPTLEM